VNHAHNFLAWSLYHPLFAASLCQAIDPIFWPDYPCLSEAEDAMLACLGCPL
jgi:hypothetical protein